MSRMRKYSREFCPSFPKEVRESETDLFLSSMAPLAYKSEGTRIAKMLFEETMKELSFADVEGIVDRFA